MLICALLFAYGINRFSHHVAQVYNLKWKKLSKRDTGQKNSRWEKKYMYIMSYILIFFQREGNNILSKVKGNNYQNLTFIIIIYNN